MGTATGKTFKELRTTARGSDHYGACEICGKNVSETHVMQNRQEYRRANGELYSSPIGGGTYGHRECLVEKFGAPDVDRAVK